MDRKEIAERIEARGGIATLTKAEKKALIEGFRYESISQVKSDLNAISGNIHGAMTDIKRAKAKFDSDFDKKMALLDWGQKNIRSTAKMLAYMKGEAI